MTSGLLLILAADPTPADPKAALYTAVGGVMVAFIGAVVTFLTVRRNRKTGEDLPDPNDLLKTGVEFYDKALKRSDAEVVRLSDELTKARAEVDELKAELDTAHDECVSLRAEKENTDAMYAERLTEAQSRAALLADQLQQREATLNALTAKMLSINSAETTDHD